MVSEQYPVTGAGMDVTRSLWQIFRQPAAFVALLAMLLGQMVMVLVMVITSLHMRGHQHGLGEISVVISAHTFGMFAFSIVSGRLSDRWGRGPVIVFGSVTLVLACMAATLSPAVLPLGVALFLLGLGWNFCYVGGSALLADQLSPGERTRTQGFNDLLVGLASAFGSLQSGFIFASLGFNVMAYVSAGIAVLPLIAALLWMARRAPAAPSAPPPGRLTRVDDGGSVPVEGFPARGLPAREPAPPPAAGSPTPPGTPPAQPSNRGPQRWQSRTPASGPPRRNRSARQ